MNKRKKEPSEGNSELSISKAKRSLRKNSHLTAENNLEIPVQRQSNDSKRKSKPTTIGTKQEWEEKSQENTEVLAVNLQTSSNDEERKTNSELKQLNQAKEFIALPLSQNSAGKFVPVVAKPKKVLTETRQKNDEEAAEFQPEQTLMMHKLQEILESNLQCTDSSLACESSEADTPEAKSLPESFQLIQTKVQETGDMIIHHCQKCISKELDVKTQNQYRIKNITNEAARVSESQQEKGIESNLQEDNCDKNSFVEVVPLFPDTLCHKDAGPHENRNLSVESLECPSEKDVSFSILAEHRISDGDKGNQNEDLLNSSLENVDQKKPTQEDEIAIKLGDSVKEEKWTKNVYGEVIDLVDASIKSKMESDIIQSKFLVDLNVTIAKEENNSCTVLQSRAEEQSRSDNGAQQSSPFKDSKVVENSFHSRGKIAEHSDLCSTGNIAGPSGLKISGKATRQSDPCIPADIVVEQRGNCKVPEQRSPQSTGRVLEQKSPHNSGKVAEQSSPPSSGRVSEKISRDKDGDVSGKDFLSSTQFRIADLRTDVEVTESKSTGPTETVNVFCIQTEGRGHSECSNPLLQPAFFSESDTGKEEAGGKKETFVGTRVESDLGASTLFTDSGFMCENNQEDRITLEQWKENGSEKVRPDMGQSLFSICDSSSNVLEEKLSNVGIIPQAATQISATRIKSSPLSRGHPLTGKNNEEMVVCEQNKMNSVPMENCLPPIDVLEQLERANMIISHKRESDVNSDGWKSPAADTDLPSGVPRDPPPVDQTCLSWGDAPSLDLELLPDSQLQWGVFGDNRLELSLRQPFSTDSNCSPSIPQSDLYAGREQRGAKTPAPIINISHLNKPQPRVEMMEGDCDPAKEEDATDVVCGLIIELSNLNRLIMSTHRDLESIKRLKYRKSRQSGKIFAHALKQATNTLYTVKK